MSASAQELAPLVGARNGPVEPQSVQWQRWWSGVIITTELGILFTVVGIQLFGNWDTWEYYNQAQLFTLHLLGVVVAISLEPVTKDAPYLLGLLLYRCSVQLVDLLVLSRASRHVDNGNHAAGDWSQAFFVVALTLCSAVRLWRLSSIVRERYLTAPAARADGVARSPVTRARTNTRSGMLV